MPVDLSSQIIDSRDLIEEAQSIRDDVEEGPRELDDEEAQLLDFVDDAENEVSEWEDGAALIREDYFEDYARELAEDVGAIDRDAAWPLTCIDWEEAADQLKTDYTEVQFMGKTYFVRA